MPALNLKFTKFFFNALKEFIRLKANQFTSIANCGTALDNLRCCSGTNQMQLTLSPVHDVNHSGSDVRRGIIPLRRGLKAKQDLNTCPGGVWVLIVC